MEIVANSFCFYRLQINARLKTFIEWFLVKDASSVDIIYREMKWVPELQIPENEKDF